MSENNTPKVSVIVPLYNRRQFLPQLFSTLEQQTFQDFELILVDDGSTDNTREWLANNKLATNQPITFVEQPNGGPYVARNHGLRLAKGQYIAFQDSDDEWPEYHLAEFVKVLDSNPDIHWVFGSLRRIDHDTREVVEPSNFEANGIRHPFLTLNTENREDLNVVSDNRAGRTAIKYNVPGSTQCALIRKTVFDSHQFDESFRTAYDRFFAIKLVLLGYTFAWVDKTHQIYHIHDAHISLVNGASPEKQQRSAQTMLRGYRSMLPLTSETSEHQALKQRMASVYAWELGLALQRQGRFFRSGPCFFKAWLLSPGDFRYLKSFLAAQVKGILGFFRKGSNAL